MADNFALLDRDKRHGERANASQGIHDLSFGSATMLSSPKCLLNDPRDAKSVTLPFGSY